MRIVFPLLALIGAYTCAWLLHARVSEAGPKPLSLTVSPLVGFAPLDLVILVRLEPVASDRVLRVVMDGDSYGRASDWSLDGAQSRRLFRVEWKRVGPGESDIHAQVGYDRTHIRATASQRVIVSDR